MFLNDIENKFNFSADFQFSRILGGGLKQRIKHKVSSILINDSMIENSDPKPRANIIMKKSTLKSGAISPIRLIPFCFVYEKDYNWISSIMLRKNKFTFRINDKGQLRSLCSHFFEVIDTFCVIHVTQYSKYSKT